MENNERNSDMEQSAGVEVMLILAGVAIGVILGLLYAPQSGGRTRRQLWRKYEGIKDRANDLGEDLVQKVEDLRESVTQQVEAGRDYVGKKKEEVLSGLAELEKSLENLKGKLGRS